MSKAHDSEEGKQAQENVTRREVMEKAGAVLAALLLPAGAVGAAASPKGSVTALQARQEARRLRRALPVPPDLLTAAGLLLFHWEQKTGALPTFRSFRDVPAVSRPLGFLIDGHLHCFGAPGKKVPPEDIVCLIGGALVCPLRIEDLRSLTLEEQVAAVHENERAADTFSKVYLGRLAEVRRG